MRDAIALYLEYESKMQRENLFELLSKEYTIYSALYPGSYIHISPSFYFPEVVYIDLDNKSAKFFADPSFLDLILDKKTYVDRPIIRFHHSDYTKTLPEQMGYFDLLISQYAGFVSQPCKPYLRIGGILVANNSHGDAGVAYLDPDYKLIGVIIKRPKGFVHSTSNLEEYFIPKKKFANLTKKYLQSINRGLGYKKTATHYIFQRES